MTVIVVRVVTVTLLIWSAGIWFIHKSAKSGCEMVTLFGSDWDDGVSAGIWVIRTGAKSGGELVTLFDSYCSDGVSIGI